MLYQPKITRRYAFNWVGIWLTLVITTWFCRPLLPYHELATVGVTWEMWSSGNYLLPTLNGELFEESSLLIHWLELLLWNAFGVSEFSVRFLAALFSVNTLLLTALAAKQLWPNNPKVRANAPLILIGSLMWAVFATAHIEEIYVAFFLMLYINFLIRAWKYNLWWWLGVSIALIFGFFVTGLVFLIYTLPVLFFLPIWMKRYVKAYILAFSVILGAFLIFWMWGYYVKSLYPYLSLTRLMGLPRLVSYINNPLPFGLPLLYLVVVLFPWVFWLPLYRSFYKAPISEPEFRFCLIWLITTTIVVLVIMDKSVIPLIPIYPAFCLIIARCYQSSVSSKKDIILVAIIIALLGVLLIIIPYLSPLLSDSSTAWLNTISPIWGIGLVVFSIMLIIYAKETRLITLALMSVALTLAVNFGVIRNARDFYDIAPASERIKWYQDSGYAVANDGRYMGQYHFLGRLREPLTTIKQESSFLNFKDFHPDGRIVVYFDNINIDTINLAEYYQPFRNGYLAIFAVEDIESLQLLKEQER